MNCPPAASGVRCYSCQMSTVNQDVLEKIKIISRRNFDAGRVFIVCNKRRVRANSIAHFTCRRTQKAVKSIQLTERQAKIVEIVKRSGPITSEQIAELLAVRRATLRPDLAILTMAGMLDARPRVGYFYSGKSSQTLVAEGIRRLRVKDVKSVPIVVREETSVYDAVVTMFVENVGTLFVVKEGGILEGAISRKDLLKAALGQSDPRQIPVTVMMTRMPNIITADPDESVFAAAKKIIDHEVDALPVVRPVPGAPGAEKLEVIGRITKTNVTKLFVELGEGG